MRQGVQYQGHGFETGGGNCEILLNTSVVVNKRLSQPRGQRNSLQFLIILYYIILYHIISYYINIPHRKLLLGNRIGQIGADLWQPTGSHRAPELRHASKYKRASQQHLACTISDGFLTLLFFKFEDELSRKEQRGECAGK